MTLVATIAALLWAVVRLLIRPVAEQAANEAERRSAKTTRLAVDGLCERLKNNDFSRVEDGLKAVGERLDRARQDRKGMEARIGERLARMGGEREAMETRLGGRIERMEKRLLAAVQQRTAPNPSLEPPPLPSCGSGRTPAGGLTWRRS